MFKKFGRTLAAFAVAAMLVPQVNVYAAAGEIWYEDSSQDYYITDFVAETSTNVINFEAEIDLEQAVVDMQEPAKRLTDEYEGDSSFEANWGSASFGPELENLITDAEILIYDEDKDFYEPNKNDGKTPSPSTSLRVDLEDLDFDYSSDFSSVIASSSVLIPQGDYYAYLHVELDPRKSGSFVLNIWTDLDDIRVGGSPDVDFSNTIATADPTVTLHSFTPDANSYSASVSYYPGTDDDYEVTEVGLVYGDDSRVTLETNNSNRIDYTGFPTATGGSWSRSKANWYGMDGFEDGDDYYVRAYMKLSDGGDTEYSDAIRGEYDEDFGESLYLPDVSNVEIVLDGSRVRASGRLNSDGDTAVTERGFVVSYSDAYQTPDAEIDDSDVELEEASNRNADFSVTFNPDDDAEDIYIRAYARNSRGYGYARNTYHIPVGASRPTVYTMEASNIMSTSADVTIMVAARGSGTFNERGVVYSISDSSPELDESNSFFETVSGTTGTATVPLEELEIDTDYYARAYANNSNGTVYGETITFTTTEEDDVVTNPISNVTRTSAVVSGTVTPTDDYTIRERGVLYSTGNSAPTINNGTKVSDGSTTEGTFSVTLSDLNENAKYYARAFVRTAEGYLYGNVRSFSTSEEAVVTTDGAENVTNNAATITGAVNLRSNDGNATITERGIVYDRDVKEPTTADGDIKTASESGQGTFSVTLSDLRANSTYYARAYAKTSDGYFYYGGVVTFATKDVTVKVDDVYNNGRTLVTVNASYVVYDTALTVSERGLAYSNLSTEPTIETAPFRLGTVTEEGRYEVLLSDLARNTTYYARPYVKTALGITYGDMYEFTTSTVEVTTGTVSSVTDESAVVSGTVANEGNLNIIEQGVVFSDTYLDVSDGAITVSNSAYRVARSVEDRAFQVTLDGLTPGTVYAARAFANTGNGYMYGNVINFTTTGGTATTNPPATARIPQEFGPRTLSTDETGTFNNFYMAAASNGVGYAGISPRGFAQFIGATTAFDPATGAATITGKDVNGVDTIVTLTIRSTIASVNGQTVDIAAYNNAPGYPAGSIMPFQPGNNRTYLPIRFLCNAFGVRFVWNDATGSVTMY